MKRFTIALVIIFFITQNMLWAQTQYKFPEESSVHEGTWLQWPHDFTYGAGYRTANEPAWIEMTRQLLKGEYVHIIAYNTTEKSHIETVLITAGINLDSVDFYIHPNNDFWIRDNGPVFVTDEDDYLYATDWNFNGWGNDAPYASDNLIPNLIAGDKGIPVLNLNSVTLEGGAIEHDGNGTFMGTISSILGDGRNPGLTTSDMEVYFSNYFGFTNFIWLDGYYGAGFDITDAHIDGFVKFVDDHTMVTMNTADLIYWFVTAADRTKINSAVNANGIPYNHVYLPLTNKNVKTTAGVNTGSKGDYINYYVANAVVLVPIYMDANDANALSIIQGLYPDKEVVGIDCRNMFAGGGMIHCVTQQQPFTCGKPRNISVTAVSAISATITWDAIPLTDSYKITKKGAGVMENYTVYTNSITLTGLTPGSNYKVIVKGKCDEEFSNNSNKVTVATLPRMEDEKNTFSVYPNPASESISINSDAPVHRVQLKNTQGDIVYDVIGDNALTIDVTKFVSGLYFVKVYIEDSMQVKEVMVIK